MQRKITTAGRSNTEDLMQNYAGYQYSQELNAAKPIDQNCTLNELLEYWLIMTSPKHKGATDFKYRYLINRHIAPLIGHIPITQINAPVLNAFLLRELKEGNLTGRNSGLSPSYVKTMMVILNSAMKYAYSVGVCPLIRADIPIPAKPMRNQKVLSTKEQIRLEHHILSTPTRTGLGVMLALRMGLRIGEICALTWDNIDFEKELLYVVFGITRSISTDKATPSYSISQPKTESSRRILPIPEPVLELMQRFRSESHSRFVISDRESFLSPATFEYRYKRLIMESGVNPVNFHSLRHTFATRCIESGMDNKTLSELLGHSSVQITLDTYVHSSVELKRKQMDKLTNMLKE